MFTCRIHKHAKMASRKREGYQTAKNVLFVFELHWTMNAKSLKIIVIKEILSWLPNGRMESSSQF